MSETKKLYTDAVPGQCVAFHNVPIREAIEQDLRDLGYYRKTELTDSLEVAAKFLSIVSPEHLRELGWVKAEPTDCANCKWHMPNHELGPWSCYCNKPEYAPTNMCLDFIHRGGRKCEKKKK